VLFTLEQATYVTAVLFNVDRFGADAATKLELTDRCHECGRTVEADDKTLHVIGTIAADRPAPYVIVGCEGYWHVDPAKVGIDRPQWQAPDVQPPTGEDLRGKLVRLIEYTIGGTGTTFDSKASTGGNCWAMFLEHDGRRLEITDGDNDLPFTDDTFRNLSFSYFTADGEPDGECTIVWQGPAAWDGDDAARYWENTDVTLRAWLAGDPYRDLPGMQA
jgi:hypothetical protein